MVSYLFKKMGKEVTYNDYLAFNSIIGKAIIENSTFQLTNDEIQALLRFEPTVNIIQNNFAGFYYLDEENQILDGIAEGIFTLLEGEHPEARAKRAIALYALFQTCIIKRPFNLFHRRNLNLRTNDVERGFGNKTTWDKSVEHYFNRFAVEANRSVFDNDRGCVSENQSAFEINPQGYDLVYLDPPYFAQNGSHETADYRKCYHFLEGLANYGDWNEMIDHNTHTHALHATDDGKAFWMENIYQRFEELISRFAESTILFSYKNGGLPGIEFIVKTMRRYKQTVVRHSVHYKYALNHQNGNAAKNREVLIIGMD